MKPYRIKHIPTGLYYKPSNRLSNLSTKGKVYLTNSSGLLKDGVDYTIIQFKERLNREEGTK